MVFIMLIAICIVTSLAFYCSQVESTHTNFEIKRFELCNNTQGIVKFYGNVTTKNKLQYIDYNVTLPYDFDENVGLVCNIFSNTVGNNYVEMFAIREKSFCKATHIYMGEFWYDLERAAQMTPGLCPMRAGRYNIHHTLLDFKKISLQTFPFGRLRFVFKAVNNRNANAKLLCILIEVENYIN